MATDRKNISVVNSLRTGVVFGDVTYLPGGGFGPRIQENFQLVVVHSGLADVDVNAEHLHVAAGMVALLLPGGRESFRFAVDRMTHHGWCAVWPKSVPPGLRRLLRRAPSVRAVSGTFRALLEAGLQIGSSTGPETDRVCLALGHALLGEYLRMGDPVDDRSPARRARRFMEVHFGDEDCLRMAARSAGVSPQHLNQLYRATFETTPGRDLWRIRVEHGAALLAGTGLSVAEIAERCGFRNPFHFSRMVRAHHGASPRALRHQAWGVR
jgi:AraC-like DNA-binding protein